MHDSRIPDAASDDRTTLAIAAGLVAALLGGAAWAFLVTVTNYEIGWAAWGIGAFVGWAMTRATVQRSRTLAVTAAALALVGLLGGKAMTTAASVGPIADELARMDNALAGSVAWQMYEEGDLDAASYDALAATEDAGDTLSDALWASMLDQASARLASLSEEEKHAIAEEVARGYVQELGLIGGIQSQLSAFDFLWILLAVGTAFRMMDAAEAPAVARSGEEEAPEPADRPLV